MPVPSNISDLSSTPGSNSPNGLVDPPSVLDDHIRTLGAFIRQLSDEKATASDVVLLTGNQTIAGVKTFSSNIVANLTGNASGTAANVSGTVAIANGGTGATTAAAAFTAIKQDASETATGVVELATTTEASTGTDTTRAVTAAGVEAHMNANAFGWGQSWTNLTGSRALSTSYTNSTGRPIEIFVTLSAGGGQNALLNIGGLTLGQITWGASETKCLAGTVPNGATYSIVLSAGSIVGWAELR